MSALSKKKLNEKSKQRVFENVEIPEWDGDVACVQSPMASEKDAFEKSLSSMRQMGRRLVAMPNLENVRARLVVRCLVDPETHERILEDTDVELVGQQNAKAIDRIIAVATRLGWMGDDDFEKVEAELKNALPADLRSN
jgi:hypothetical protein